MNANEKTKINFNNNNKHDAYMYYAMFATKIKSHQTVSEPTEPPIYVFRPDRAIGKRKKKKISSYRYVRMYCERCNKTNEMHKKHKIAENSNEFVRG